VTRPVSARTRELVDALAVEVSAGEPSAHVQAALGLLNMVTEMADASAETRADLALRQVTRGSSQVTPAPAGRRRGGRSVTAAPPRPQDSIYTDERYLANAAEMLRNRRRIVGGKTTKDFPDCVAVGSKDQWCCSGTLVAPKVVLTAAHCARGDCSDCILVGESTVQEGKGQVFGIADVHVHPDYVPDGPGDLAALVLERDVSGVQPRPIESGDAIERAKSVRLVGFGNTESTGTLGYGTKRLVDVPVASTDPRFGADAALEFVAGRPFLDRDSCNGDSGGPAYVQSGKQWLLAGATSRATASSIRACGDGGIYERVQAFQDWLQSVPGWSSPARRSPRRSSR
jgi:secreted trypsin-like serine protease